MTINATGKSSTNEALCPKSVEFCGMENGAKETDTPLTRTRLKRLAPIIFPRERELCPLIKDVMAVTSSGKEVPRATKV